MTRRRGSVWIEGDRCKGCGLCVPACPFGCFEPSPERNRLGYHPMRFVRGEKCTACGVCFYACPEPAALTVLVLSQPQVRCDGP